MNAPDSLPLWFAFPTIVLAWSAWIVLMIRDRMDVTS